MAAKVKHGPGLGSEALLESAAEIVERATAQAGIHSVEASLALDVSSFSRFADVGPTQGAERARLDISLRVRCERHGELREARAEGQSMELADVDALIERARSLAEVSPALVDPVPFGGAVKANLQKLTGKADEATLSHDAAAKVEAIGAALEACETAGLQPAGLFETGGVARVLLNSAGRSVRNETSKASFALTATVPDVHGLGGAGWGSSKRSKVGDLDIAGVISRAIHKAAPGVERRSVEPGEYTVVLEPAAVASMLLFASYRGFGAKHVEEQASFLCDHQGKDMFPHDLVIRDQWNHPLFKTCGFDGEGSAKKSVALLEHGILTGPVTNRHYAQKLHGDAEATTGHAVAGSMASMASCLAIDPGKESLKQLVGGVKNGLLVSQFHYTNVIDAREMMLTGMTRNGLFMIEDGQIGAPCKNLRFTQGLLGALQNVTGIGSELDVVGALFSGEVIVPALRIDGFRFTSKADF